MENISIISRILGSFFYYPITQKNNQEMVDALCDAPEFQGTGFDALAQELKNDSIESLNQDFLHLFEGAGVMPAPPWGSVYLDKEQVIFGDSALEYRAFLASNGIELNTGVREPEDQFGLMLLAVSQIIESKQNIELVKELLSLHLLPWAYRYLELVKKHAETQSYQLLADIAHEWCDELKATLNIIPTPKQIYR